jgi:uncharacterized protein YeaC (DUF1315 family)
MIEWNDRREDRTKDQRIGMVKAVMAKQNQEAIHNTGYVSPKPVAKSVVKKANKQYKRGRS